MCIFPILYSFPVFVFRYGSTNWLPEASRVPATLLQSSTSLKKPPQLRPEPRGHLCLRLHCTPVLLGTIAHWLISPQSVFNWISCTGYFNNTNRTVLSTNKAIFR